MMSKERMDRVKRDAIEHNDTEMLGIIKQAERVLELEEESRRYHRVLELCKYILDENRSFNEDVNSSYITGLQEGLEFAIDEFERALKGDLSEFD